MLCVCACVCVYGSSFIDFREQPQTFPSLRQGILLQHTTACSDLPRPLTSPSRFIDVHQEIASADFSPTAAVGHSTTTHYSVLGTTTPTYQLVPLHRCPSVDSLRRRLPHYGRAFYYNVLQRARIYHAHLPARPVSYTFIRR